METLEKTRISMAEAPKGLIGAMYNTEKYIKSCGIPHSLLELIKTRSSQINHCGYCIDMHIKDALNAGETFERLYLLDAWQEAPCFTDEEKAVLNLTEALTNISMNGPEIIEKAYERMTVHYSKEQIANVILAICQINSWNRIAITFGHVPGSYNNS